MSEEDQKRRGSTGIVLGPGAKGNSFIGVKVSGFKNAVVTESDGVNFPEGNRFVGGEFNRYQARDPTPLKTAPPAGEEFKHYKVGVSIPLQKPPPLNDYAALLPEPWYRQLVVQIASGVIVVAVIAFLVWLGLPLK
ncbi:hypothetical protein MJP36_17760 [Pseudomonas palleroniana]|uniref:hypothetical protein n=1 Tax=Pseudomonas palleroniana TaxID=191390 RepID=UPI001FCAF54C|nr:hypothetical protein [Pseudomonas palleroniana]UOK36353.1 hypothetical protein MJP36_17760 [Pseudomonas palleroniana]